MRLGQSLRLVFANLFFLILFTGLYSVSQAETKFGLPPTDLRPGQFVEGDLFKVKMVPGDSETTFFVVGKEAAKLKYKGMKVDLILDPTGAGKVYNLRRKEQAFVLDQKLQPDKELQLKIQSEDGHVESLRLKARP